MQNTTEKIDRLATKVKQDVINNAPFYNRFISLARSRHGLNREDAEDVWQNVLLRLTAENSKGEYSIQTYHYYIDEQTSLQEDKHLSAYLMTCLFNGCRDQIRKIEFDKKKGSGIPISSFIDDGIEFTPINKRKEHSPLENFIKIEEESTFVELLHSLKDESENILRLYYVEGMKYPEIASALGIPLGTVKSRMSAAKRQIKEIYESKAA